MFFKNFITNCIVNIGDILLNAKYVATIKKWNEYDKMTEDKLNKVQAKNLSNILIHASKTVPFYINTFKGKTDVTLQDFPILTKELLRKQKEHLVSNKFDIKKLQKNYSSGSSGVQSYSYVDKKYKFKLQGIQSHWYMWTGYKVGNPILQFGISPKRVFPKNLKDIFYNVHYLNSFSLNEKQLLVTYDVLVNKKVEYIIGYPSAINEFAKVLLKNNRKHKIKGVISLGDKLFPHFKNNFNNAFNNPTIIDTYGCAEGIMIACTADSDYYYIMSPNVVVEIVDDNGNPVKDGEIGNVLVTNLSSYAMPLIRYKLGDLAIKLPREKYPKNRRFNYPMLEKIVGRETDVVNITSGKKLIVHSFTGIVEFYPEIKQFKIIQKKLEEIDFEYIIDEHFEFNESVLEEIKIKIDFLTDSTLQINFKSVKTIKPTASGKPQIIESYIKPY